MNQKAPKRPRRVSLRSPFILPAVGLFACLIAFAVLLAVLSPAPPRTVMMATGAPGSAYAEFGERYRELLARHGVTVQLISTNGAVDNLHMLGDVSSGVSIAFIQFCLAYSSQTPELVSLGTLFYEPVWLFVRGGPPRSAAEMLKGRRVSIGPKGS